MRQRPDSLIWLQEWPKPASATASNANASTRPAAQTRRFAGTAALLIGPTSIWSTCGRGTAPIQRQAAARAALTTQRTRGQPGRPLNATGPSNAVAVNMCARWARNCPSRPGQLTCVVSAGRLNVAGNQRCQLPATTANVFTRFQLAAKRVDIPVPIVEVSLRWSHARSA